MIDLSNFRKNLQTYLIVEEGNFSEEIVAQKFILSVERFREIRFGTGPNPTLDEMLYICLSCNVDVKEMIYNELAYKKEFKFIYPEE